MEGSLAYDLVCVKGRAALGVERSSAFVLGAPRPIVDEPIELAKNFETDVPKRAISPSDALMLPVDRFCCA